MKQISIWAKQHPWSARIGILGIYLILPILAIIMQIGLARFDITVPSWLFVAAVLAFLLTLAMYPLTRTKQSYRARKMADLSLSVLSFLLLVFYTGLPDTGLKNNSALFAATASNGEPGSSEKNVSTVRKKMRWVKRVFNLPIKLKARVAGYRQAAREHRMTRAKAGLLIALTCLVGTGLAVLLAAGACSIACSGTEGAAIIVVLLGAGAITVFLSLVIRAIVKRYRRDNPVEASTENN